MTRRVWEPLSGQRTVERHGDYRIISFPKGRSTVYWLQHRREGVWRNPPHANGGPHGTLESARSALAREPENR